MKTVLEILKAHIEQHPPSYGDAESVLAMLYECHNECNPYDNEQIRADFEALYQQMNGMPIIGLDDHSNQTIRMLESGELSDTKAFFSALNKVYKGFRNDLLTIDASFNGMFASDNIPGALNVGDNEENFKQWLEVLRCSEVSIWQETVLSPRNVPDKNG